MGFSLAYVIIAILWGTLSTISIIDYLPHVKDLKGLDLIVFYLVFLIGGPVFGINEILTSILELILPEGWDDDDDFIHRH